jgi:hypothetical protein
MRSCVEDRVRKGSDGISSLKLILKLIASSLFMMMVTLWPAILKIIRFMYPGYPDLRLAVV